MPELVEFIAASVWDVRIGVVLGVVQDMNPSFSFMVAVGASMAAVIPAFFILRHALWISDNYYPPLRDWLEEITRKHHQMIERYAYLGVFLLVAVPLPGTGPWMGVLTAAILNMEFARASLALIFGIATTALLTLGISEGVEALLPFIY